MSIETEQKIVQVSRIADGLVGSEIIKLAGEVKAKIAEGKKIHNLTIGDFNPEIFPIPPEFKQAIIDAYTDNQTNYPPANGIAPLREEISKLLARKLNLQYHADDVLVAGGGRPLIYATYKTLIDEDDKVIFPVPSWNNNHYTHLMQGHKIQVSTTAENNFMPTAADIAPHIQEATLIALCSPLNPTGTVFTKEQLGPICEMVVNENKRRKGIKKPIYVLFDQIYWMLTYGETNHCDPVSLMPEMKDYTIYIDGMSKAFAATGVRVGWAFGPSHVIAKMKSALGHIGAWSPKAEQVASATYLAQTEAVENNLKTIKTNISDRLNGFYQGFKKLKQQGLPIDVIAPQAAMYLTVKINITGYIQANGKAINNTMEATQFILNEANVALVPFYAFGTDSDSTWYRLSVGTVSMQQIGEIVEQIKNALLTLKKN